MNAHGYSKGIKPPEPPGCDRCWGAGVIVGWPQVPGPVRAMLIKVRDVRAGALVVSGVR